MGSVVALAGQVGGAKLADGLYRLRGDALSVIVNTGDDYARIPEEVLDALHAADLEAVVIGPANPYHAIRPMLEIDGMKRLLRRRGVPVVAVTPIVGGRALRGSAGKMMRELGRELSARSVAGEYLRIIDGFVLDIEDATLTESGRSLGMEGGAI